MFGLTRLPLPAGNILVRVVDPNSLWGRVTYFLNIPTAPRLVLLDAGMTAELTRQDQMNLVKFFRVGCGPHSAWFLLTFPIQLRASEILTGAPCKNASLCNHSHPDMHRQLSVS